MGDFKDDNGKSRLKALLEKLKEKGDQIPEPVFDLLSMIAPRATNIAKAIFHIEADQELHYSSKEKIIAALNQWSLELEHITIRHGQDMNSENNLSKMIRPIGLIFLFLFCGFLTIMKIVPGGWNVYDKIYFSWMDLLKIAAGFYYGLKGVQRITQAVKSNIFNRNKAIN